MLKCFRVRSISNDYPISLMEWDRVISSRCSWWSYLVGFILMCVCSPLRAEEIFEVGQHFRDCPVCPEMVVIPAGEITVKASGGSGEFSSTYTLHIPSNFAIAINETRVADWESCEFDGGCGQGALNSSQGKTDFGWREWKGTRPISNVSWAESLGYAIWLSARSGKSYWLPSEVEWEYAARGGWTEEGSWVNLNEISCEFSNLADHHGCSDRYKAASPVGSYGANQYGLYDMSGNVSEWTANCSGDVLAGSSGYSAVLGREFMEGEVTVPELGKGIFGCDAMVYRGGGWSSEATDVGFSSRETLPRGKILETLGFRVVRSIQ